MKNRDPKIIFRFTVITVIALCVMILSIIGCKPEKPPGSDPAAAFKKEVQDMSWKLAPQLIESVSKKDAKAVHAILEKTCNDSLREGKGLACGITVLDETGVTLTSLLPRAASTRVNYSRYKTVMQTLKTHKTAHSRLFLQDGSTIYAIGIPLIRDGRVIGLLGLNYNSREMNRKYGMTDQDFLALDFNR
jgi:hypothetical protein